MGVTIHYRGSLADLSRVEDFEDRLIDLALDLGGNCRVWRSADEQDSTRAVRGLILDLAPGQESTSLLISPEGWLIGLMSIEEAERGALAERPWCCVKTQFGPLEGHVALVELFSALKAEFMPDLEVSDEAGYWEERDVGQLQRKIDFVSHTTELLEDALASDGLSREAAEDPQILATRIERLARKVHETISRPAEHAPVDFPDDESGAPPDPAENEARWDALYKENRRTQERLERELDEQMILGVDAREALEAAIEEATLHLEQDSGEDAADEIPLILSDSSESAASEETWREDCTSDEDGDEETWDERFRHPLHLRARELWMRLHDISKRADERSSNVSLLMRSAGEIVGGFAQALPLPPSYEMDDVAAGRSLVQLKRALRGAAFVAGALLLVLADTTIDAEQFRPLHGEAEDLQKEIVELLRTIREMRA
jgi:hypothetical protein